MNDHTKVDHSYTIDTRSLRATGRQVSQNGNSAIKLILENTGVTSAFIPLQPVVTRKAIDAVAIDPLWRGFYGTYRFIGSSRKVFSATMSEFYPPLVNYTVSYVVLGPREKTTVYVPIDPSLDEVGRSATSAMESIFLMSHEINDDVREFLQRRLKQGECACKDTVVNLKSANSDDYIQVSHLQQEQWHRGTKGIRSCIRSTLCDSLFGDSWPRRHVVAME